MTDLECFQIQAKAIGHLMRCAFDDWGIEVLELGNALTELKKEYIGGDVE